MIKVLGAIGDIERVKEFYAMIDEMEGLVHTSRTYNAVFSAAANCKYMDAQWLLQVYGDMEIQPNDFVLSSFFSAMSFAECSREQIDRVFAFVEEARAQSSLNAVAYTAFLMFLARQDMPERAVDIWNAARQDEIDLSPHFFSAFFTTCAKATKSRSSQIYNMAIDAFDDLSTWWLRQDIENVPSSLERNTRAAYNAFLHFLGEQGHLDLSSLIFESMNSHGPLPDVVTYNTMLHILGDSKDVDAALNLYWEMLASGIEPTDRTFGSLLHTFASVGDKESAKKVFDSLHQSGMTPNSHMFTSFINAAVRHGGKESLELAFSLAQEMREQQIELTDVTYGSLFIACEKLGDVSKAFDLYQQACDNGIRPSDQMHNILISVCTQCGKVDEALELVKAMARRNSTIQQHTMNSLTRALSIESPSRALRMLSLMQTMDMQPSRQTRMTVVRECAKAGEVVEALNLYHKMQTDSIDVDESAGSALIVSLCEAQNLEEAVSVYDQMMASAWRGTAGKSVLPKRAHVPNGSALASLAQTHAAAGLLSDGWKYYAQLRRQPFALQEATVTHRRLFEGLIEGNCRQKNLKRALQVFDDWKSASAHWQSQKYNVNIKALETLGSNKSASPEKPRRRNPKLGYVTLAYLEACCNNDQKHRWRVYDVLSVIRSQKESKRQAGLARPQKHSHHVLDTNFEINHQGTE